LFDEDPALVEAFSFPPVRTMIKADLRCASVAAVSVLAKTTRDAIMERLDLDYPGYGWSENRGYATPEHMDALRRLGASPQHRQSWRLPLPGQIGVELAEEMVADLIAEASADIDGFDPAYGPIDFDLGLGEEPLVAETSDRFA